MASDAIEDNQPKDASEDNKDSKIVINSNATNWLVEILIIVSIAIIVVGPKDFPKMLKKVGTWIGSVKRYVSNIQSEVSSMENETKNIYDNTENSSDQKENVNKNKNV